ncbi:agouti-signaling protein-like [Xyrichtys novacula]|uniref:Agouti-signaling protein-like n=1 Tax=Xyrichtys novacula TaxID=13765 RepID=A0AAV1HA13_XYRNO|nr:agouti-signaling protein-like [Xyrichtys novacula]
MKLSVLLFGFLQLSFISAGLLVRDPQSRDSALTRSKAQIPKNTGSVNPGRKKPLFARRGQYERQRVRAQKPKKVPPNTLPPPPGEGLKPAKPKCSQLTQSCVPQSGCCDSGAMCHCRFFNAICFCRKTNSLNKKKSKT